MSKLVLTDGSEIDIISATEEIKFTLNEHGTVARNRQFVVQMELSAPLANLEQAMLESTSILRVRNNSGVLVYEADVHMRLLSIARHIGDTANRVELTFKEEK